MDSDDSELIALIRNFSVNPIKREAHDSDEEIIKLVREANNIDISVNDTPLYEPVSHSFLIDQLSNLIKSSINLDSRTESDDLVESILSSFVPTPLYHDQV